MRFYGLIKAVFLINTEDLYINKVMVIRLIKKESKECLHKIKQI